MGLLAGTIYDRPPRCEHCGLLESECCCVPPEPEPRAKSGRSLRLGVEKRKHGRMMTVVRDLGPDDDAGVLLTRLKNCCGAGGSVQDGVLEIQGAHADRVRAELLKLGYRVRG